MNRRANNSAMRWVVLGGILIATSVLARAAVQHAMAAHLADTSDPGQWLRAAEVEPSDAENWYRLGRYRQLDFEHANLPMAISYYERATALDPASALYWMDLASAYETNGNFPQAEQALRMAQEDYPASGEVAWRFGNFLLRQGRTDEAFQQIRRAVTADPTLTSLAVSRVWRSAGDIDRILKLALPPDAASYWGAIDFFMSTKEVDPAMAVWARLVSTGGHFPVSKSFPFIDMLIGSGRAAEAKTVWQQALVLAGVHSHPGPAGSLLWNGGFEDELNGGFDWRYQLVTGVDVSYDVTTVHGGNRSLRLVFDGASNVNFQDIWQYVVVEPQTRYRLGAFMRVQDLTTDSGIRFEIEDYSHPQNSPYFTPQPAELTPSVTGTQPWAPEEYEFTTGPQTNLLRITLKRTPSNRFGNKISGTAWVDDVSLIPIASAAAVGR